MSKLVPKHIHALTLEPEVTPKIYEAKCVQ
jgi:hypothetical protein